MQSTQKSDNNNIFFIFTGIIQIFLILSLVYFFFHADWFNAFLTASVILLNLFPVFLHRRYNIFIPPEFHLLSVLFIFMSIFLGSVVDLYYTYWWWDILLHTSSGFLLGLIGFAVLFLLNQTNKIPKGMTPIFICFFAITFAVFLGVVWEIYEYIQDLFIPSMDMQDKGSGVNDTMTDLIVDMIGAIVVSSMGYLYLKTGRYSFIADSIQAFMLHNPELFSRATRKKEIAFFKRVRTTFVK